MTKNDIINKLRTDNMNKHFELQSNTFKTLMAYFRCAIMEIETKFNVLNEEFSLQHDRNPIADVKSRLKSVESIKDKLRRKNLPITCESIEKNINDVAGIRVICTFIDDVYMLADAFLSQDDITLIQKKDYIENPKPNGYRSLHLIVEVPIFLAEEKKFMRVEIQLRTIAMDFWASLEHQLNYKKNISNADMIQQELKNCAEVNAELDRRMSEIKKNIAGMQ
ncbi:MAG: GTP pyrophosphokinase family protein [Clostridia bacterium]|nr:GTP pyrophosphokinase family protein [Clostridia bacterium]